jgi:3-phosphoshikimate 1-carboxyvinyltransferase
VPLGVIGLRFANIKPKILSGSVVVPPSKSIAHRAIICASLSEDLSVIRNFKMSKDMEATITGMSSLGAIIEDLSTDGFGKNELRVRRGISRGGTVTIDCIESGSTLRFLIPIALATEWESIFTGRGRLVSRPLGPYYDIFRQQGIEYSLENNQLPLTVKGALRSGEFVLDGKVSSQFISGLLFSLPMLNGRSRLIISNDMESKGYVDLTIDILKQFGINIDNNEYREFTIEGGQKYKGTDITIEGDYSQAAFWLVGGVIGDAVECRGIKKKSLQGDREIVDIIQNMKGRLTAGDDSITTMRSDLESIIIDVAQCPDLVPILAVLGTFSNGTMELVNGARVRLKESDRLKAISCELNKLGADISETSDGLIIRGVSKLNGGEVDSWNDHRIAMALAIAATRADGEVVIRDSGAVEKSYPNFWEDFRALGGKVDEQ